MDEETVNDELDTEEKKTATNLPSDVERILAQQHENEQQEASIKAFGGPLSDQPVIDHKPCILLLLKKYLFQYNGVKHVGIFANGSINDKDININKSPHFISNGDVSLNECNVVKQLIETNKITITKFQIPNYNNNDKHYAMIFAELIKIWLFELDEPLLQEMPSTFFDGMTCIDYLELDIDKIPEPQLSSLLLLWDICAEIDAQNEVNKMNCQKLSIIFAPYLYQEKDAERHAQILSSLTNFFEVGIKWRQQNNIQ
eukprot:UN07130